MGRRSPLSANRSGTDRVPHQVLHKNGLLGRKSIWRIAAGLRPIHRLPSSRLISDAWRQPSELTFRNNTVGIGLDFVKRIGGNTFSEFWPDIWGRLMHRNVVATAKHHD